MGPESRVIAFLTDFEREHAAVVPSDGADVDFDRWRDAVAALDRLHFANGAGLELGYSFGYQPSHGPTRERITGTAIDGAHAVVQTERDETLTFYFEYGLVEIDGDWRIASMMQSFDPPGAPFVSPEKRARFEEPEARPLRDVEPDVQVNGDRLFEDGRTVTLGEETDILRVRDIGTLRVTTGILVTGDLGYDADLLEPLGLHVPPGEYPVQTGVAFGRNAAVRVRFSDAPVVAWHPADAASGGHVVGVDAANVAILDASAVLGVTAREKERAFDAWARDEAHPATRMLSLAGRDDGVIAASGWGDGAYPGYWGLDASGAPAQLLLDFLVLAEFLEDTLEVPADTLASDALADRGLVLALDTAGKALKLTVTGGAFNDIDLLGADGEVLADTRRSVETTVRGQEQTYTWKRGPARSAVHAIRIRVPAGRRN
ncbi:MAG: DUF4241 domain-containing protein [Alphaproteobacteria bacterium]|nr:DUF4241 domain-containing protein [Alphaproteobacteria bacterium]